MLLLALTLTIAQSGVGGTRHVDASTPVDLQIALAESAAPPEVSRDAAIYVLDAHGYRKVRDSKNGFACLVSRQHRDTVEPECFDAEGTTAVLPARLFVERRRAEGAADEVVERELDDAYRAKRFAAPKKAGLVYMLSPNNYVFDPDRKQVIHFPGHLMFYAPYATEKEVGRGEGAPFIVAPGTPRALMIVVPAGMSDHK